MSQPPSDSDLDLTIAKRVLDLVDRLPHLVGVTDDQGRVLWMNTAGRNFVGATRGEQLTTASIFTEDVFDLYYAEIRPTLLRGEPWSGTLRVRRADGTLATVEAVVVGEVGPANEVRWLSTLAFDVTEHLEREERLSHLASHDPLTGLPNRTLLTDRLSVALSVAERTGGQVAVMALDLDRFKMVNDLHGHTVGDRLLQQVTARLEAAVRPTDTVARVGGDEFIVILHPPDGPETAAIVSERIRRHVAEPSYVIEALQVRVSASIGLVLAEPGGAHHLDELIRGADRGMYRAKRSGGNCVCRIDLDEVATATSDTDVGHGLAQALAQGQVVPVFEPVIDLRDGVVTELAVETRWQHPTEGMLSSEDLLGAATATGYADLVWWSATRSALRAMVDADVDLPVEITLSDFQLREGDLADRLAALRSLAPEATLRVEVAAETILELAGEGTDLGEELSRVGVELVLIDHGPANVPLAMLESLPLAAVKLAPSLAAEVREHPRAVSAAAELARAFGVPCIATGVRSVDDLPLLAVLGVASVEGPVNGDAWDAARLAAEIGGR